MGIFNRLNMRKSRDAPVTAKRGVVLMCNDGTFKTLCGEGYTSLAACPEVRMCVNAYADAISSMTVYLMQNTDMGDVRVINGLSRRLDVAPNRLMTRKAFIYNIVYTMLMGDGNAVVLPRYSADGLLEELIPLAASLTSFVDAPDGGYKVLYKDKTYNPDEVLHFAVNPDSDRPWRGTGYRMTLTDALRGLKQANATKRALLESPSPSLIVKVDGLTEEFASKEGRAKLAEQYIDSSENGKPWFIPSEAFSVEQVKPLTLNDLALKVGVEMDKSTVAGMFGVPPYMVGVGTYNKEAYNNWLVTRVMPLARIIEQEMTRKLLYAQDLYIKFNPRSLYAYDLSEIIGAGSAMVDRMAMTRNEWRDWVGLSPNADMTELLALENYIPADRLGDQKKLTEAGGESNEQN